MGFLHLASLLKQTEVEFITNTSEGIIMNARMLSFSSLFLSFVVIVALCGTPMLITGCASSEEMTDEMEEGEEMTEMEEGEETAETTEEVAVAATPVDPIQKTIDSLQAENATLMSRINKLEQDNKGLMAQVADLESKLSTMSTTPPRRMSENAKGEYDHALSLFNQRSYQEALSVWMGLLNTGAPEGLESNCHYWIGECYYALKQYQEAISHFEHVLGYPRTTKKDDAQLKLALCYERMGDKARAKQEYQTLLDRYPASPYAARAKERMARL